MHSAASALWPRCLPMPNEKDTRPEWVEYNVPLLFGPRREKTYLRGVANNTVADQPAHPRRLISTFVIPLLKSIISKLATSEISS